MMIDLSVPVGPDLPCTWPGHDGLTAHETEITGEVAVRSRTLSFDEHLGTHADTSRHMGAPADEGSDYVPLTNLSGPARVLDARGMSPEIPGVSPQIGIAALEKAEHQSGAFRPGDVALLWTGWSDRHYVRGQASTSYVADPIMARAPGWPAPSTELLRGLAKRGVRLVGIDAPSIGSAERPLCQHLIAFELGITPVENLTNLGALREISNPLFLFLPLALEGATGLPGRAVALRRSWGDLDV